MRISSKTLAQSPGFFCRKSRIVEYQGLLLRSMSHRQSGGTGSATQTGTPTPPPGAQEVSLTIFDGRSYDLRVTGGLRAGIGKRGKARDTRLARASFGKTGPRPLLTAPGGSP